MSERAIGIHDYSALLPAFVRCDAVGTAFAQLLTVSVAISVASSE
jgi:hypothetical protein